MDPPVDIFGVGALKNAHHQDKILIEILHSQGQFFVAQMRMELAQSGQAILTGFGWKRDHSLKFIGSLNGAVEVQICRPWQRFTVTPER